MPWCLLSGVRRRRRRVEATIAFSEYAKQRVADWSP
jgi:hypothetical protein